MLAGAYVDRVRATTGRTTMAPEVVYVNSGMWDVMRFAKIDLDAGESVDTSLGPKRLAWYRRRVRDALTVVGRQFPDASLFWSATHYREYLIIPTAAYTSHSPVQRLVLREHQGQDAS